MDQQNEFYKEVSFHQGAGFEIPVLRSTRKYKYGQCFGDVLCGIWRFIKLVAI